MPSGLDTRQIEVCPRLLQWPVTKYAFFINDKTCDACLTQFFYEGKVGKMAVPVGAQICQTSKAGKLTKHGKSHSRVPSAQSLGTPRWLKLTSKDMKKKHRFDQIPQTILTS